VVSWKNLLLPLTPLYSAAVQIRAAAYRRGVLKVHSLGVPVVSVGNLTFGGTGKTPVVAALARDLVRRGHRPAVLTRGYGRSTSQPVVVVGPDHGQSVATAGDEPLELAHRRRADVLDFFEQLEGLVRSTQVQARSAKELEIVSVSRVVAQQIHEEVSGLQGLPTEE
jgi:tetraacyldisaccharide 4'-kinase